MSEYIRNYIKRLRKTNGNEFVEQLYQALKEEHCLEEAQLPPVPGRAVQLKPEHDIRSRAPGLHKNEKPVEDTGFHGCQIRYKP